MTIEKIATMKSITQLLLLVLALLAFAYPEAEPEAASTNWRGNGGGSDVRFSLLPPRPVP